MIFTQVDFASPEFDAVLALRDLVLRKPLKLVFTREQITSEYADYHFACYIYDHRLVGTLLMKNIGDGIVKMRQVAVHPSVQKKGIGKFMVREVETWCRHHDYNTITLAARVSAVPFYKTLGYTKEGKQFEEVGIPHFTMTKGLL